MYHESIPVIIGSGDVASFGPGTGTPSSTAGDFTVPLVQALELPGRWQVRLDNVSYPNPNFMKTADQHGKQHRHFAPGHRCRLHRGERAVASRLQDGTEHTKQYDRAVHICPRSVTTAHVV